MEISLAQWLVILICAVLIIGYIAGNYYSRQRAEQILAWLHSGLEKWGTVSAGEKLPGMVSGGQLIVQKASEPFLRIEASYRLAPRENPLFWLFHRLQGRNDELLLKINLPKPPKTEMTLNRGDISNIIYCGKGTENQRDAFVVRYGKSLFHLAIRRKAPHLIVRVHLPALMSDNAETFFNALGELMT